jgi:hypothetical protein
MNKIKNAPEKIYLIIDNEVFDCLGGDELLDFSELHEVCHCSDRLNDNDVEYRLHNPDHDKALTKEFIEGLGGRNTMNIKMSGVYSEYYDIVLQDSPDGLHAVTIKFSDGLVSTVYITSVITEDDEEQTTGLPIPSPTQGEILDLVRIFGEPTQTNRIEK